MSNAVNKTRYGVVCKAPNNAKYGEGAMPEYYLHTWTEEVQTDEWDEADWISLEADEADELASCQGELATYK